MTAKQLFGLKLISSSSPLRRYPAEKGAPRAVDIQQRAVVYPTQFVRMVYLGRFFWEFYGNYQEGKVVSEIV
jgi:hypothetical protein